MYVDVRRNLKWSKIDVASGNLLQFAIEHGPVEIKWIFPLKNGGSFHSYVKFPEGIHPFSYGFPMVFPLKPPYFPMVYHGVGDCTVTGSVASPSSFVELVSCNGQSYEAFIWLS